MDLKKKLFLTNSTTTRPEHMLPHQGYIIFPPLHQSRFQCDIPLLLLQDNKYFYCYHCLKIKDNDLSSLLEGIFRFGSYMINNF